MRMRVQLPVVLAGVALAGAVGAANALDVFVGNNPQPAQSNLIRNACGLDAASGQGTSILGCLNDNHAQLVSVMSDESLVFAGGGQARVEGSTGGYSLLTLSAGGANLTSVILNLNVSQDGFVSFSDGTTTSSLFKVVASGQNFFTLTGTFSSLSLRTFADAAGTTESDSILDAREIRLGTAVAAVPEPQTYALMLAGLGVIGFLGRRRFRG